MITPEEIRTLTERSLIKISAEYVYDETLNRFYLVDGSHVTGEFNPAHNDADSRLLARRLRMLVQFYGTCVFAESDYSQTYAEESYLPNAIDAQIGAAERLAVLRVAGAE